MDVLNLYDVEVSVFVCLIFIVMCLEVVMLALTVIVVEYFASVFVEIIFEFGIV